MVDMTIQPTWPRPPPGAWRSGPDRLNPLIRTPILILILIPIDFDQPSVNGPSG